MKRSTKGSISVLALALTHAITAASAERPSPGGYAPIDALPRWEGSWNLGDAPRLGRAAIAPMPFRPEVQALLAKAAAGAIEEDPDRYCRPAAFAGISGGVVDNIEFLFTPGRVTLLNESGLIRRIYTDGRKLPEDTEVSHAGTSVGRWDGQTLVVETAGLDPSTPYLGPTLDAIRVGRAARITERITLLDAQRLEFDVTIVAPDLLTAPERRKVIYTRAPASYVPREVVFCSREDRSIDPATGRQRFDMTPPPDLPLPPPR